MSEIPTTKVTRGADVAIVNTEDVQGWIDKGWKRAGEPALVATPAPVEAAPQTPAVDEAPATEPAKPKAARSVGRGE